MSLTSTQIGTLAENLIANELMIESSGRLSPFQPIADDECLPGNIGAGMHYPELQYCRLV